MRKGLATPVYRSECVWSLNGAASKFMVGNNILHCVSAYNDGGSYGFAKNIKKLHDEVTAVARKNRGLNQQWAKQRHRGQVCEERQKAEVTPWD